MLVYLFECSDKTLSILLRQCASLLEMLERLQRVVNELNGKFNSVTRKCVSLDSYLRTADQAYGLLAETANDGIVGMCLP